MEKQLNEQGLERFEQGLEHTVDQEKLDSFLLLKRDLELLLNSAKAQKEATVYSNVLVNLLDRSLDHLEKLDPRIEAYTF